MICDSCIIQLNVAYNFKMKAIESDTKLRQFVIEKGFGIPESTFNLAITDNRSASSASNFIMHDTPQSICDFVAPEPMRQRAIAHTQIVQQTSGGTATTVQQEYLRHFETPQSMTSNVTQAISQFGKSGSTLPPPSQTLPFRCMPIQIKIEPNEYSECTDVSPAGSDENLQTVSDTSSVQSNGNLSARSMVRVNNECNSLKSGDDNSDKEFVNAYLQSSPPMNISNGSSSKSSLVTKKNKDDILDSVVEKKNSDSKKGEVSDNKKLVKEDIKRETRSKNTHVNGKERSTRKRTKEIEALIQLKAIPEAKPSQKMEDEIRLNSVTKSGRKVSHVIDLRKGSNIRRVRPSQDRRRKEVKAKLTPKRITATPKLGQTPKKPKKQTATISTTRGTLRRNTKSS